VRKRQIQRDREEEKERDREKERLKKHRMKMIQQSLFRLSKRPKERKKPPNSKTFKNNTKDGRKETQKSVSEQQSFPP
jgi:CRISPR/Cas system-associated endoribonuclease Cas2